MKIDTTAFSEGDRVRIRFCPQYTDPELGEVTDAQGTIMRVAGFTFLQATSHRTKWQMPQLIDLAQAEGEIELIATHEDWKAERAAKARGEKVFDTPETRAAGIFGQLDTLANMIATASASEDFKRRDELDLQFRDISGVVGLAKRKQTYLKTRAIIGHDFHPWTIRDPRVFRIETVRPIPADFEPDKVSRSNRERRLSEAVSIFGEAERETRLLASNVVVPM